MNRMLLSRAYLLSLAIQTLVSDGSRDRSIIADESIVGISDTVAISLIFLNSDDCWQDYERGSKTTYHLMHRIPADEAFSSIGQYLIGGYVGMIQLGLFTILDKNFYLIRS